MARDVSVGAVIVNGKTVEFTLPSDALMLVDPTVTAVASPVVPMVATPLLDELQVT